MDESLQSVLKDFITTFQGAEYDFDRTIAAFPELSGYGKNVLLDYVSTAEANGYDYEKINPAFQEFGMEADKEGSLEEELTAPPEVETEVKIDVPKEKPLKTLEELNKIRGESDEMSEEEYQSEVSRTIGDIVKRGKALNINATDSDDEDDQFVDTIYDKLAVNSLPKMDQVLQNNLSHVEELKNTPLVTVKEIPDPTYAESTGITKKIYTQVSNEEANKIHEENKVKPTEEQVVIEKLFNGRGPAYYDDRSIEDQTADYNESVKAIKGSNLSEKDKNIKIDNLHKPTYSTLKDVDGKMQYAIKPEFQEKVNTYLGDVQKEFINQDMSDPEVSKNYAKRIQEVSSELVTNDPILQNKALSIQNILKPKYEAIRKSIEKKYNLTLDSSESSIEAAEKEYNKLTSELFQNKMSKSPIYQHVVSDINNAIGISAEETGRFIDKMNNPVYAAAEVLKGLNGFTGIAGTLLEQGYSAIQNQGKSFNAAQISQQQLGLEERTSQINEIKNIQAMSPGQEIYAFPDGTLDYGKMGISTFGQGDPGGLTEGQKPKQKYSVSGDKWESKKVNPEKYIADREVKNNKSEEIILGDLEELQKYAEVAELADTIDFEDEDGTTFKDVVGTVGQVLPNIVTGIVGTVAAPATGGLSLLGSSLLIGGQEYGDNYWTALETGLREELGREPSNEEIVDALANGDYADQGTAAGWAALSAGLELGTFGSINKALKTTASSMGFKGTKDFVTKVMNGELRNAVKNSKSFLVNGGKGYIKEYFTEASQELAGQASVGQQLDNDILKRIDLNSAHQAGTGGGIVGAILPSAGSMSRGSFSLIRKASRQAAITLNLKNAENFKQQTKFFQDAQNALKTKLDKKQITPEQYQEEVDAISNLRNSSLKIPKEFSNEARSKALDLMVKQKKLQEKAKEQLDEFSGKDKIALAEVNQELTDLSNSENAINNAIKLTKDAGLDVSIIRKKTTKETQKELRKFKLNNKQSKAASKNFGIHVVDGKDGKRSIVLNEEAINKSKKWTTAQHEVLHDVLSVALEGNDRAVFAMGNAVDNVLKNVDGKSNANFKKRLDAYKDKPESIRAEEKITLLSEALTNGEVTFDEGVFTKLGDFVRRVFQQIAPESKLGKIKFDTAEDVYRFIKDYNKSFAKGKLTKAQKNVLDKGIEISEDITPKGPLQKQDISVKESIDESALQEEGLSIQDETGQEIDEEIETSRIDEMDEITKAIPQEVIDKELDKTATEEEVLKQFKPLATFIASQYIGNAKYQANRKALIDSILTDERGILGLYRDYQAKTDQEFDGTAGQFINNQKGGIRQRSKQIAAEVLGYAAPKTGPKKSPIPEGRQEGESLRRTMGFFTVKELDQMLADREINKPQYDKLLKSSQQQVIKKGPNKGKTYGDVIDGFFNKVKTQIQKGVLTTPKQIVSYLTNEFKTKRFVDDVKDLMGTPNSQQYTDFLNNFSEAIYDKLTQRQVNKRFAFAKEPVIDPATGKQKRMTVGESQAIGTQVSDKKAGNPIFKKKAFDENQFKQEHLNPTTGRPASKQTALAESVAEIIGFDASQQALQDPETLANLTDRNKTMAELEVVSNDIANQTARGMTFKFSLDDGSTGSINQEDAPNLQKDLDTFNKLVLDKGFEDGDGNLVPEVAEALEKASPKLRELINYLYKENPDLNVDAKGFKNEVLEAIKIIDPALYDKIKSKGTVLRSIVKGVKNYNKVVTDKMNAGSQALGKTIDNRVFGALGGFDFLGYKNGILDPAGKKVDKKASKEQGKTVYQTDEDGNFIEGMYYNDIQALKELEYTDDLFEKYVKDLDNLGIKLSDSILMNKDSTKLKNILKPIFETTNLERKKQLLEEARPKIEKANTANKLLFKYIANKLNEAYKKRDVDLEYVFQMLQTQTNIAKGFRSLSGFDFMYLQEGNQYVEGKNKPSINKWLEMTDAKRAEMLEDFNTVNDFKERYDLHLKNNLEAGKLDLINAQWQAAFGTVSAYKDLTIKGEHLGANANTMAKIFIGIAEGNLTDAMLEEMFVEHTQLFGPTYLMDVIDAKGVEGGKKTGATSKEGLFRLTKFLKNNPKFSKNLYAKSGEKAFIELGNVEKLIEDIKTLDKSQNSAKDENVVVFKESKVLDIDDNMSMDDVLNKAKTVDEALKQAKKLNAPVKKIRVFDFDDTLATTKSGVKYTLPNETGKPQPSRKAILLVGSAGAGKSTLVNKLGLRKQGYKYVNQDVALDWLTKNAGLPKDMNEFTDAETSKWRDLQSEAAQAAKTKATRLQGEGSGVIIDTTGSSSVGFEKTARELANAGYDAHIVFVDSSLDTALKRNKARGERKLTDTTVKNSYEAVQKNKKGFSEYTGRMVMGKPLAKEFTEINTDNLKQGDSLPAEFISKINDFTSGYLKGRLTAEEFAQRGTELLEQGAEFDFSEFNKVTKGKPGPLLDIAKKIQDARGTEDVFVLTARPPQASVAIKEFLDSQGLNIPLKNITGLGKSTGEAKANWIIDKAAEGYNDFYFADDAIQNVQAVRDALEVIDIKSEVQQAKLRFSLNVDKDFNDIIEQKSGIASEKEYSEAKAKVRGANKGKFKFWIPPSAEDFMGLIYPLLSKGKLGDSQMAWFKKHLLDPFAKANQALSQARLNLMNDFKALKKDLDVPKELSKESVDGFTNEQAVRVYLWNKQGLDIPGLSKTDAKELVNSVENNEKLKIFADKLVQINKRAYPAPAEGWLTGSITSDLIQGLKVKRSELLAEWQSNADIIFSKKNLNKLEAIHGAKYREALENVLSRMKAGSNRLQTGNRLSNRILNYINGSNAAIMFFNTRSAILQTISAINFINWDFNNPLKAGKAFANQPQYWKDFMSLMNSDFLRDRRNGLRININESEIADLAKTSKNKAKAVMAYILEKGYLPTQFADSFAIALGGATFYRNKIDALIKDGMSKKEAEEVAMREFREIAEESQQSARPDKISQQQSSDVGRLILMFANTPMQYSRLMKRAFQDLVNGRGSSKSNMSKIVYYGFVQNLIFNALQQALFKLGFEDDEEDEKKRTYRTINGMADSLLRGLGIGGATVSVAKNFLMDIYERSGRSRPEYTDSVWKLLQFSPPIGSKIARLRAAGWAFDSKKRRQEIIDKGFSLENPGLMSAAKVISATTNVPLDRVLLKMENIEGSMNEEAEWWQRLAMIGGWPSWDIMKESSSKPKSSNSKRSYSKRKNKRKYNKRK